MRNFTRLLALSIAPLLALMAGCASSSGTKLQETTPEGNVVTTYDDPKNGFRLTYESQWEEQSLPAMLKPKEAVIVLVAPADVHGLTAPPMIMVAMRKDQGRPATSDELDAMERQSIEKASKLDEYQLISHGPATLGGEPARRIVYRGKAGGITMQTLNVLTLHNGQSFAITYSASPSLFDAHLASAQRVIESVHWISQ